MSTTDHQHQQRACDVFLGNITSEPDDDEQSIIDVFEFDDTAHDRWLCSLGNRSRKNSVEAAKVDDLDAWLHADEAESAANQSDNGSRRSIDTRTFTRIKRRSNRLNFDEAEASVSSDVTPAFLSSLWKNKSIPEANEQINNNNNNGKDKRMSNERKDSIPMMLRPKTNQVLSALLSESPSSISSQTSMEAFMSIARKEGNNFLLSDINDPDVSSVLMNISQPSLLYSSIISDNNLYSSIMSDSKGDENVQSITLENNLIDSQILTDSMMEASMFKEVQDTTTFLSEFLKHNTDVTVLEDKNFHNSCDENDKTFISDNLIDKTFTNVPDQDLKSCNATFVTDEGVKANDTFFSTPSPITMTKCQSTVVLSPQDNFLNTTHVIVNSPNSLNSTKIISSAYGKSELLESNALSTTITLDSENNTDKMLGLNLTSVPMEKFDATFQMPNNQYPQNKIQAEICPIALDATFNKIPPLRAELLKEVQRSSCGKLSTSSSDVSLSNVEIQFDATYERSNSAEPLDEIQCLDATYVQEPSSCHRQSESQAAAIKQHLDATYDSTNVDSKLNNETITQSKNRFGNKNVIESQAQTMDPNRFNTFRKDSKIGSRLAKAPLVQENDRKDVALPTSQKYLISNTKGCDNNYQQKYKTFSKKTNDFKGNMSPKKAVVDNQLDEKFAKPLPKQIPPPRTLSKLPQLFQKSNPNLGSSLKTPRGKLSIGPGYSKGSQPNIASNMPTLGRFKSERLLPTKSSTEFSNSEATSRSMESIDSATSAHSAPDLDDQRSVASDNSRTSYTIHPKNLDNLKKLGSLNDKRKFNGSTPKVKGPQFLENKWAQDNNLPSPILKNGLTKNYPASDSRSTSPSDSAEFTAKTSSPLTISPSNSDQTLNIIANDDCGVEASKENIKVSENVEPAIVKAPTSSTTNTKLRRPSNWAGASNKIGNGASSGIPRPASRIPAPKFTRPNLK